MAFALGVGSNLLLAVAQVKSLAAPLPGHVSSCLLQDGGFAVQGSASISGHAPFWIWGKLSWPPWTPTPQASAWQEVKRPKDHRNLSVKHSIGPTGAVGRALQFP